MALIPQKPKRVSAGIVTIALCIISIVFLTVWFREGASGPLHTLRAASLTLAAPFQKAGTTVTAPLDAIGDDEDESLQRENEELTSATIRLEEYRLENERLLALLELVDAYSLEARGARIISRTTDNWNRTITIDKGSADAITVGMPVLSADGLIGQTETVGRYSSVVRLITDQRSGVAVFLQSARIEGVLTGSQEGLLYLNFVPLNATVTPGEAVITSGAGGLYPKGLIIGVVASVQQSPSDVYKTIIINPVKSVGSFEEVVILTGRESEVTYTPPAQSNAGNQASAPADGASGAGGSS